MKIAPLTYRVVIGYFLPGWVALLPLYELSDDIRSLVDRVVSGEPGAATSLVALSGLALIIGHILEAVRYSTLDIAINRILYGRHSAQYSRNVKSQTDLKFYDLVFETSYAPYQFYSNSFLSFGGYLISGALFDSVDLRVSDALLVLLIMSFLAIAAVRATYGASERIKSRFLDDSMEDK